MIVKLQIPDEVWESYDRLSNQLAQASPHPVSPEELMASQLDRFQLLNPTDRVFVIDSRTRSQLEQITGGASLKDAPDLLSRVLKMASISIGDIRLDFTPGQLLQLKTFAGRNHRPVDDVVRDVVKQLEWQFFDQVQV